MSDRPKTPRTTSDIEVAELYSVDSLDGWDPEKQLGKPGEFPFTRGVQPTMYRGRLWTMRQYAGFSTAAETNKRFKYLLQQGQTGLSTAFDLPTQMGYDPDAAAALGEVGRVGVPISSVDDMEVLLADLPLGEMTTSMTINATAAILLAFYVAVADGRGIPRDKLGGTVQNDILKEYIARGTYIYPTQASMRLVTDIFEFCAKEIPRWNTISISGYHMREAGATAAQELAFTLANGIAYVDAARVTWPGRRRVRRPAELLLRRVERALRGSGQVPRRAPDVGADHAGALRRQGAAQHDVPLPRPDRWVQPHGAIGRQQRGADDDRGSRGGAGRRAEPAHQRARRGACAPHGRRRATGPADPTDHRLRKRRGRHARPSRGQLLRGEAD